MIKEPLKNHCFKEYTFLKAKLNKYPHTDYFLTKDSNMIVKKVKCHDQVSEKYGSMIPLV